MNVLDVERMLADMFKMNKLALKYELLRYGSFTCYESMFKNIYYKNLKNV